MMRRCLHFHTLSIIGQTSLLVHRQHRLQARVLRLLEVGNNRIPIHTITTHYLSDKMAEQITLTIGEAFDLAYERFIKRNGRELENQKLIIMLR